MMNFCVGKKNHFTNKNGSYSIEDIYEFERKNKDWSVNLFSVVDFDK